MEWRVVIHSKLIRDINGKDMKIKRILAFLAGIVFAILAVGVTNQPEQVSASVFQKTSVPKKFRGTWYL